MSIILNFFSLAQKTGDISCDLFRAASLDTWKRIGFSRTKPRLTIHETTITQNLVYELHLLQQYFPNVLKIYESTNEKTNGDDLEISVSNIMGGYFTFALQAKILYHNLPQRKPKVMRLSNGRYKKLQHYVGNSKANQVDLLLTYARNNGFIPLYVLYNYVFGYFPSQNFCAIDFDITQYGCSIVHAQYLKSNYALPDGNLSPNVKFTDLHPSVGLPWFVIPCCFADDSLGQIFDKLQVNTPSYEIKSFSEAELINPSLWKPLQNISFLQEQDVVKTVESSNILEEIEKPVFNPKFKIVI